MNIYRIYTEKKDPEWIAGQVAMFFDAFTILEGTGYWKGTREDCLIIELIVSADRWVDVELVAERIRKGNKQEAVLVTDQPITTELIEGA